MRDLENCRQEIDEIDAELVRLFERRMGVAATWRFTSRRIIWTS